jgi:mRNA-degrading endonuclease RelE of RelBE toxin-antitoxin system
MKILQHRKFINKFKRLQTQEKLAVEEVIKEILVDPIIGELKIGNLAGIRVMKFKYSGQLRLIAYSHSTEILILHYYGPHENFYRDLKK